MIARLWKTGLKPGRAAAYEEFAREIPQPMFRRQEGFLGFVMGRNGDKGFVLTFCRNQASVDALAHSTTYKATVEHILAAGLLTIEQSTEVTDIHLLALDPAIRAEI